MVASWCLSPPASGHSAPTTNASATIAGSGGLLVNYGITAASAAFTSSVTLTGSGAGGNKDYSIGKLHGRGILTNWNDSLWITRSNTAYRIVIPQGFYDNLGVCAALKTALDTFPKFIAQGVTFAVVYDLATGLFTITPSSGTIGYFHDFVSGGHLRHSTAESVFGLMTDVTSESSSLTSNIAAPSIGTRFEIVGGIASAATKIALTEQLTMDIDTALYIEVSKLSNANLEWRVVHQEY